MVVHIAALLFELLLWRPYMVVPLLRGICVYCYMFQHIVCAVIQRQALPSLSDCLHLAQFYPIFLLFDKLLKLTKQEVG